MCNSCPTISKLENIGEIEASAMGGGTWKMPQQMKVIEVIDVK